MPSGRRFIYIDPCSALKAKYAELLAERDVWEKCKSDSNYCPANMRPGDAQAQINIIDAEIAEWGGYISKCEQEHPPGKNWLPVVD